MTIRLLCAYEKYPTNTNITLDAGTEAGLLAAKLATTDLTGGTTYVPPVLPNQKFGVEALYDGEGNFISLIDRDGNAIGGGGGGGGAAQVPADWNATQGVTRILNKPTIPSAYSLPVASATVAGGVKVGANLSIDPATGVLSATGGGGGGGGADVAVPFAVSIPLSAHSKMASAYAGSALAFSPAAGAVSGGSVALVLYSDGVNIPTFPGFLEAASSSGFDASAVGAVNYVDFWADDRNKWFAVTQPTPNTPDLTFPGILPVVKYISTSADGSKILVTFNVPLATATAPAIAQFIPNGRTVTAATLSNGGLTLTLTLSAAYVGGNTATLSYAQGTGPLTSAGNGNLLAAFTNKAVTNLVGVSTPLQFALTGAVTENADTPAAGQYTYSTTASAFSANTGVTTRSLPASTDGFVTADGAFTVGQGQFMLALKAASTAGGYLTFAASIGVTNTGKYATSTGASQTASSFAYTPGDQMRLRRTAGNIIAEFATAAAPSVWIPILTLATANTVQLWAAFDAGTGTGTRALTNPQASASFV